MADRRMFSKTIVDSDAFLDMPATTQNLYFHLNMRADDEGFVDAPKKIMRAVGANQNDIEILLAKRYLLSFESGVIVIKHWKIHNCIRKDRMKDTLYQEEKAQLFEKGNGSYTDCQPNDNQLSTMCQPSVGIGKDSIGKDREGKESMGDFLPTRSPITEIIEHWNEKGNLPQCKYTAMDIPRSSDIATKIRVFGLDEIKKAIDNLSQYWEKVEGQYRPASLDRFVTGSIDVWLDSAKPWERFPKTSEEIAAGLSWEDEE